MTAYFYLFVKVLFLAVFMTCLTPLKFNAAKSTLIIAGINVVIWIANCLIYTYKGVEFLSSIFPLTASVPAFICYSLVSKSKKSQILFSLLTVSIFGMLTSFIGFLPSLVLNRFSVSLLSEFLCFILIILFIVKAFRKPYFKMLDALEKGWGLICLVPALLAAVIFLVQYYPTPIKNRPENAPLVFLVYALMFVFYTIAYLNFDNISHYYQLKQDKKIILMQTEMQKKEYAAIMDRINAIQIYRHDMRHHLNAINALLNDSNIPAVKSYLGKLNHTLSETTVEKYCENYSVNLILSAYINKARNEKINVESKVQLSEDINIDPIELGVVFANAIENAIIACSKIDAPQERKIEIVCREHNDQLYIQISNPFIGEVQFDGDYPVSEHAEHGIGTRSLAAIANRHGGIFSFAAKDGFFKSTLILNCR